MSLQLTDSLKPVLNDLYKNAVTIGTWVKLSIPKTEVANNFGVQVQESALHHAENTEAYARATIDSLLAYHLTRAVNVLKVCGSKWHWGMKYAIVLL
jgi:hypothetical protein